MLRLKELRVTKGVSQGDVAKYLGITQQAYANYERGARKPDPETITKLADYFEVTADYLLGRSDLLGEDQEVNELLQELKDRPEYRILFSTARRASADDIKKAAIFLKTIANETEEDGDI